MSAQNAQKILNGLGFGWLFKPREDVENLTWSDLNVTPLTGNFDQGYALGLCSDPARRCSERTQVGRLLHRFKYDFDRLAGAALADLAVELINRRSLLKSSDLIITVPSSFTSRPFDPISVLAQGASEGTGIRWEKDLIKRIRITKLQKRILHKAEKEENVVSTFRLDRSGSVFGKRVLLLDDLYDSGATMNQISRMLKRAGADKVFALTLVKTSKV